MTKTQLRAWAGQELDRVTAKVGEIDDISSERYGTALNNISQLQWLAYPGGVPWEDEPDRNSEEPEGHTDASDQEEPASDAEETAPEAVTEQPEETPALTLPQVRTKLAEAKKKGIVLPEVLAEFGTNTVSGVAKEDYGALLARVDELLGALG